MEKKRLIVAILITIAWLGVLKTGLAGTFKSMACTVPCDSEACNITSVGCECSELKYHCKCPGPTDPGCAPNVANKVCTPKTGPIYCRGYCEMPEDCAGDEECVYNQYPKC